MNDALKICPGVVDAVKKPTYSKVPNKRTGPNKHTGGKLRYVIVCTHCITGELDPQAKIYNEEISGTHSHLFVKSVTRQNSTL